MSISLYLFGSRKIQKYDKLSNNINFLDERIIKIIINEFDIERLDYKLPENFMNFLQYADGKNNLDDIREKINLNTFETKKIYKILMKNKLIY